MCKGRGLFLEKSIPLCININLLYLQWRVAMNAMHSCSLALFLDLCYGLMKMWKSYDPPEATVIPKSFYSGIIELFENVERKFGHTLVSHAVRYVFFFMQDVFF